MARHVDYDFSCANNTKVIRFAVNSDEFHSARFCAEFTKNIDLSGGTKNLSTIHFSHCLKMTRIIWPSHTGHIEHLLINSADSLRQIDLSLLPNLKELSILNCESLASISGLSNNLELINIHNTKIQELDLNLCQNLKVINLNTNSSVFHLKINSLSYLHSIYIQAGEIELGVKSCAALKNIYLKSNDLNLVLIKSTNIVNLIADGSDNSKITGLNRCKKIEYLELSNPDLMRKYRHYISDSNNTSTEKNMVTKINEFKKNIEHAEPGREDVETIIEKRGTLRERNQAVFIKVSLLSEADKDLANIADLEYSSFVKKSYIEKGAPQTVIFKHLPWVTQSGYKKATDTKPSDKHRKGKPIAGLLAKQDRVFNARQENTELHRKFFIDQYKYKNNRSNLYKLLNSQLKSIRPKYFNYYLIEEIHNIKESMPNLDRLSLIDITEFLNYLLLVSDYYLYYLEQISVKNLKCSGQGTDNFFKKSVKAIVAGAVMARNDISDKFKKASVPGQPIAAPPVIAPANAHKQRLSKINFNKSSSKETDPAHEMKRANKQPVRGDPLEQQPSLNRGDSNNINIEDINENIEINLDLPEIEADDKARKHTADGEYISQTQYYCKVTI